MISGFTTEVIQAPRAPAKPWLTSVATKIPAIMGIGFLKGDVPLVVEG
jgi:hypothetical protein